MRSYVIMLPLMGGGDYPLCRVETLEGVQAILDALLRNATDPPTYLRVEVLVSADTPSFPR